MVVVAAVGSEAAAAAAGIVEVVEWWRTVWVEGYCCGTLDVMGLAQPGQT